MLVFAAARYTGNIWNKGMYDMQIDLKGFPFLEAHLKNIGLLNFHPVSEIMCRNVKTLREVNRVSDVEWLLKNTQHQGFPILSRQGHVKGFILRKNLCMLIKLKNFSYESDVQEAALRDSAYEQGLSPDPKEVPVTGEGGSWNSLPPLSSSEVKSADGGSGIGSGRISGADDAEGGGGNNSRAASSVSAPISRRNTISLSACPQVAYETIERGSYPKEPSIHSIKLSSFEREAWLDLRQYFDSSPYVLIDTSSIQKAYRYFRTLGLRHLLCTDHQNRLTGILSRKDLTERRLESYWLFEEDHVGTFQRIDGDAKPIEDFFMMENGHLVSAKERPTDADDEGAGLGGAVSRLSAGAAAGGGRGGGGGGISSRDPLFVSDTESPRKYTNFPSFGGSADGDT